MWFSDGFAAFSNVFNVVPYYVFLLVSLAVFISPIDPTKAAQDFAVYRLNHFDVLNARVGMEYHYLLFQGVDLLLFHVISKG